MLVLLFAVAAIIAAAIGFSGRGEYRAMSSEDRCAAVTVVLVAGWPLTMTFFLGPIIVGTPNSPLFPALWYLPSAVAAMVVLTRAVNTRTCRIDIPVALIFMVSAIAVIPLLIGSGSPSDLLRWGLAALLLSIPLLKQRRVSVDSIAWACRATLLLVAVAVLAAILLNPASIEACRTDKCGAPGQVLTSPFAGNGNVLGLSVALLLPFALVNRGTLRCGALVVCVVALGELAGSRTAYIGVAIVVVLTIALRVVSATARRSVLGLGIFATVILSMAPAFLSYGDQAFSFRGSLWNQAKSMIGQNLFLGRGPTAWETYGTTAVYDANYSPHNAWLDMTLSIGLLGVAILVIAIVVKVVLASSRERDVLIIYFCGLLGASTLESLFTPYFLGIIPFAVVLPLLVGPGRMPFTRFTARGRSVADRLHAAPPTETSLIEGAT